jgi:hypothetical protein
MFKTTTAKTPEEYINLITDPVRKEEVVKIHNLIKATVPGLEDFILVGMIGYGHFHYKYPSGREGDWSIIALASQKNYISVYVCAAKDGQYIAEKNKDKLGKVSVGRSCIRFKKLEDVDIEQLKKVIKEGAQAAKDGNFFP